MTVTTHLYSRALVEGKVLCKWCGRHPTEHTDEEEKGCARAFADLYGCEPRVDVPPPLDGDR